jgi:hypothetical protein
MLLFSVTRLGGEIDRFSLVQTQVHPLLLLEVGSSSCEWRKMGGKDWGRPRDEEMRRQGSGNLQQSNPDCRPRGTSRAQPALYIVRVPGFIVSYYSVIPLLLYLIL